MANQGGQNYGKELLRWDIKEHHEHARGALWFVLAGAFAVAFLLYSIATRNFLFAFIIIMFGVILATHSLRPAREYSFGIAELGILLGERFYPWKDIARFWIIYQPPEVKTLYFDFDGLRPRLAIALEETDPNDVRDILLSVIPEDTTKNEEPLTDKIARVLKI